jgi:predicted RNA-binding Zn-ribbon protein involved in translation (DUF1610 family)
MNTSLQHKTYILKCPSCGAQLAVAPGVAWFGCKYCAVELVVVREEETMALKRVPESI